MNDANLGTIHRQILTVDIAWAGDPDADWSAFITEALMDDDVQLLVDVSAGPLHECREHAVKP